MEETTISKSSTIKGVIFFVVITFLVSALLDFPVFSSTAISSTTIGLWLVMWVPGLVGLVCSLMFTLPKRSFGLTVVGRMEWVVFAVVSPGAILLLAYVPAWVTGLADFNLGGVSVRPLPFMLVGAFLRALGEEIGWRGFLFPALRSIWAFNQSALVSGIIWAAWHFPAIIYGGLPYNSSGLPIWYELTTIGITIVAMSYVLSYARERSGSVWIAALLHGVFNWFAARIVTPLTIEKPITKFIVGDYGIFLMLASVFAAYLIYRIYIGKSTYFETQSKTVPN